MIADPAGACAAGYVRVSSARQEDGFSPDVQRAAIRAFAAQQGYDLVAIESDVQTGRAVSREGYQKILAGVRAGVVHAVIVYMFDRWGRQGAEWIARAHELERAGVPFVSVQEGREEGGMMRFIRAGMAEEYSRQLAKRVRPAKERSARAGQHAGPTPFGYARRYPERTGGGRYVPGLLVPDPATAWVVGEMFSRYAAGGWSLRTLAGWLNAVAPRRTAWTIRGVQYVLRNVAYRGQLAYNRARVGYYETSAPGSAFVCAGRHEPLVSEEVFSMVQRRLEEANLVPVRTRLGRPPALGAGLLRCRECGGPMAPKRYGDEGRKAAQYVCRHGHEGRTPCRARSYLMALAHDALLAQVGRLVGRPWDVRAVEAVLGSGAAPDPRDGLQRALGAANEEMKRHIRRFSAMVDDPTEQEIAAHRAVGKEISARIAGLEAELAGVPAAGPAPEDLRALHARLVRTEIPALVDTLAGQGDEQGLRELLLTLVRSATIAERIPAVKSKWLRASVTWTPDVQTLLDAGLLTLGPDARAPEYPATKEQAQRAARERYMARKRAGLVGVVPPARSGL